MVLAPSLRSQAHPCMMTPATAPMATGGPPEWQTPHPAWQHLSVLWLSWPSGSVVVQVGVVCKGVPFPFWMRGQAVLTLRVVSAAPADVVRLAPGAEVSIAPQPRVRPRAASSKAAFIASADQPPLPPAWFRIQVGACLSRITYVCPEQPAEASVKQCTHLMWTNQKLTHM